MPKKQQNKNSKLDNFVIKQTPKKNNKRKQERIREQNTNVPSPQNQNNRKLMDIFNKNPSISKPIPPIQLSLQTVLQKKELSEVLARCKIFDIWLQTVTKDKLKISYCIRGILQQFIFGQPGALWSFKYKPRNTSQVFQSEIAEDIKLWIQSYSQYRNKMITEISNSFVDDFDQSFSPSLYNLMQKFQWKFNALILRGKQGIGKTSLIRAICKELNYQIHECSAQLNQRIYLKENNQCTKSQNVQKNHKKIKKQNVKNNLSLNSFVTFEDRKLDLDEKNTLQLIRDLICVYPQQQKIKFFKQLKNSITSSKIPFIITINDGEQLPTQYNKYDTIDIESQSIEKITQFFWAIYYLQKAFKFNRSIISNDENIFKDINLQLPYDLPQEPMSKIEIEEIVKLFNGNLLRIYNFLQFRDRKFLFNEVGAYLSSITSNDLLLRKIDKQFYKSYKKPEQQKQQSSIKQKIKILQLQVLNDYKSTTQTQQQYFFYQKFRNNKNLQNYEENLNHYISIQSHHQAKKQLLGKIAQSVFYQADNYTPSLKIKQFGYLSLLFPVKRNRRHQVCLTDNLKKFLDQKKISYLSEYTYCNNLVDNNY